MRTLRPSDLARSPRSISDFHRMRQKPASALALFRASGRHEPERRLGDASVRGAKRNVAATVVGGRQAFAATPWRSHFEVRA